MSTANVKKTWLEELDRPVIALGPVARDKAAPLHMRPADRRANPAHAAPIIETVAGFYGITSAEILGHSRCIGIVWPRHVAAYLMITLGNFTAPECARVFHWSDRTGSHHAVKRVRDARDCYADIETDLGRLSELVRARLASMKK
jgi:chromosomal replication initiation ATPase DnaA